MIGSEVSDRSKQWRASLALSRTEEIPYVPKKRDKKQIALKTRVNRDKCWRMDRNRKRLTGYTSITSLRRDPISGIIRRTAGRADGYLDATDVERRRSVLHRQGMQRRNRQSESHKQRQDARGKGHGLVGNNTAHSVNQAFRDICARGRRRHGFVMLAAGMTSILDVLVPVAIGAVAIVLLLGLGNMMKGGSPNRSQQLMRLRVVLQAVAIALLLAALWFAGR